MISELFVKISRLHKNEASSKDAIEKYIKCGGKELFVACEISTEKPESAQILCEQEGYTHCLIPEVIINGFKKHPGRYVLDTEKVHLTKEFLVSPKKVLVVIERVTLVIYNDGAYKLIFEVCRPWGFSLKAKSVNSFLEPVEAWKKGYWYSV